MIQGLGCRAAAWLTSHYMIMRAWYYTLKILQGLRVSIAKVVHILFQAKNSSGMNDVESTLKCITD